MRAGISTACFYPNIKTEDTMQIINRLGFNLCEVFLEADSEMSAEFCSDLKSRADFYGVEIYSVHPFSVIFEPFLFDRYERRRTEMEHKFSKVCTAAQRLGAKYYVFHGQRNNLGKCSCISTAEGMDRLCTIASEYGISIAWENVSWCMSSSPEFIKGVAENMKSDIRFTLDIKQAIRSGRNIYEYMDVFKDNIVNLHISDSNKNENCLLPGDGDMDLREITKSVRRMNDMAPSIIEVYNENYEDINQLSDSRKFLEGVLV